VDGPGAAIGVSPVGGDANLRPIAPYSYSAIGRCARGVADNRQSATSGARLARAVPRAKASLDRLDHWRFNVSRGESLSWEFDGWVVRPTLDRWLDEVSGQDFSGDVYAYGGLGVAAS